MKFLTNTYGENFYKDLEEVVSTMEPENKNFSNQTILKREVKKPDGLLGPGTFGQFQQNMVVLHINLVRIMG